MGYKGHLRPEMPNGEMGIERSQQMTKRRDAELSRSEIPKASESYDIRSKVVSGEPFTSSAVKRQKAEYTGKNGEFTATAREDANLHSDTTFPDENDITKAPQAKDEFSVSCKKRNMDEQSKKRTGSIDGTKQNKQFHS